MSLHVACMAAMLEFHQGIGDVPQGEGETLQQRRSSGLVKFLELAQAADGGGSAGLGAPNGGAFPRGAYPPSLLSTLKCGPSLSW